MTKSKLFIITGTSAVGKTTIAKLVLKKIKNLKRSLTYTTRPKRAKEKNHHDYHFISPADFKKKIKNSEFLEWANNYGNLYSTSKKDINKLLAQDKNVLVVIDIKGALNIKKQWPKKSLAIFILPESLKQLSGRFRKRHDTTKADIAKRLKIAKWELAQANKCDFQVINKENKIEAAVKEVVKIINNNQ